MSLLPLKDFPDFCKDTNSKAILNVNTNSLLERKRKIAQESQTNKTNQEIYELKNDIQEIKTMLAALLNNKNL